MRTSILIISDNKMKTLVFVILIGICSTINGYAQNRIHGWETEKIISIRIELTSPDDETGIHIFNTKQDIDTIISFLKKVDFRELDGNSLDTEEQLNNWRSRIIFQGQRDQVYLFEKSACIGKTSFLINRNVINDFRNMVKGLSTKGE